MSRLTLSPVEIGTSADEHEQGGAPMKAVMTPMGISWGATMVRASRSPTTMNEAPNSTPTGSTRR